MGLALDEPRDDDETHTAHDIPIIMDPFAAKLVKDYGGIEIKNSVFGPMAKLSAAAACG
jgi:hypothetical protein